jgi:hypothetical protein
LAGFGPQCEGGQAIHLSPSQNDAGGALVAKRYHAAPAGRPGFVQAMVDVWRRPSLTAMEVAWRWVCCIPLLYAAYRAFGSLDTDVQMISSWFQTMTVFKPVAAMTGLRQVGIALWPTVAPVAVWFVPALAVVWVLAASAGRTFWLHRYDPSLAMRTPTVALLTLLKLSKLVAMLGTWVGCWVLALRVAVIGPTAQHQDPNLVLLAAMMIGLTLALFVAWSLTSWILQLAPLIAMTRNVSVRKSIVTAIRAPKKLRSQLIETNLVMGIVKVALLVLWMVFSACPLPFSSVETQQFLNLWWAGVAVWWLLMSDYFHVVRIVAVLRLLRASDSASGSTASGIKSAS